MKTCAMILCLLMVNPPYVDSHGGGTDSNGCHNSSSGGYHCHGGSTGGGDSDETSTSPILIFGSLAVAVTLLGLWIADTQPSLVRQKKSKRSTEDFWKSMNEDDYEEDDDEDDDEESSRYKKQDSFSVSTTPLLIPQGGGLSLELSF